MTGNDLLAIWVTLRLALISTFILLVISIPFAWWLSQTKSRTRPLFEAIVALPLVLPPTVLGFYLLVALGPNGPIGGSLEALGLNHLAFSFSGLVIGSVIYSLPFAVQPLQNAFTAIPAKLLDVATTLRSNPWDRFWHVVIPLAKPGVISAAVLSFAHTLGEFGVVLMIGGNIPGETQVVSIAIYDHVESLNYERAHLLSIGLLIFSMLVLLAVYSVNGRNKLMSAGER
ncbi:molybdate ABC transporter permease subunit [Aliidiomarina celeris]|uniref:molybdate ABC transporter permease subunit n=1 Tax=Aliidiomarina celeris TaxID=2249428 RepID=UPI000DE8CB72|nr:molybdate ABC transporter permease subunit [Aliidiomarina celeris]